MRAGEFFLWLLCVVGGGGGRELNFMSPAPWEEDERHTWPKMHSKKNKRVHSIQLADYKGLCAGPGNRLRERKVVNCVLQPCSVRQEDGGGKCVTHTPTSRPRLLCDTTPFPRIRININQPEKYIRYFPLLLFWPFGIINILSPLFID